MIDARPATEYRAAPPWQIAAGVGAALFVAGLLAVLLALAGHYISVRVGAWPGGHGARGVWAWVHAVAVQVWYPAWREHAEAIIGPGRTLLLMGFLPGYLLTAAAAGGWAFFWCARPPAAQIHVRGRRLTDDPRLAAAEAAAEAQVSGAGLALHPAYHLSRDRESRHILVIGSVGGGKTVILRPLMEQAIARGDKCLIYDNKCDFTSLLPDCPNGKPPVILAPWDARGVAWDVAADVLDRGDARTLAARLVPASSDPLWAAGSRALVAGMIQYLQQQRPEAWTFRDLIDLASGDPEKIQQITRQYAPEAKYIVEEMTSKTTLSFLIQLGAYMAPVRDMADAWAGSEKAWSMRRWLLDDEGPEKQYNTLILQGNKRYKETAEALAQAVISAAGGLVNSPEMRDSSSRRIWLFLDEFPQIGKLADFAQFLEIGRSKGVCVVLGCQDVAQVREIYSKDTADAWSSMIGTFAVARTQGAETPEWISRLIGEKEIKVYQETVSEGGGRGSHTYQSQTVRVVRPEDLSLLGPRKEGVEALLVTGGEQVYRLTWPYPSKREHRPGHVPAAWVRTGRKTTQPAENAEKSATGAGQTPAPERKAQGQTARPAMAQETPEKPSAADFLPAVDPPSATAPGKKAQGGGTRGETPAQMLVGEGVIEPAAGAALDLALPGAGAAVDLLDVMSRLDGAGGAPDPEPETEKEA